MFNNCLGMKKFSIFNLMTKKRTNRESKDGNKNKARQVREASLVLKTPLSKRQKAELMLEKMPRSPDFGEALRKIIYDTPISEASKDVLRLIKRVTLIKKSPGKADEELRFVSQDALSAFKSFLIHLVNHFESPKDAETLESRLTNVPSEEEDVDELIKIVGDHSRTGIALRCLNQSVAITGHTHIKCNVCPLPTRDLPGETGWRIVVVLAEYVQVKHSRREQSVALPGQSDSWEIEFDVTTTFDKQMTEITNSQLVVTGLKVEDNVEEDFKGYLVEKFGNGNLVIC